MNKLIKYAAFAAILLSSGNALACDLVAQLYLSTNSGMMPSNYPGGYTVNFNAEPGGFKTFWSEGNNIAYPQNVGKADNVLVGSTANSEYNGARVSMTISYYGTQLATISYGPSAIGACEQGPGLQPVITGTLPPGFSVNGQFNGSPGYGIAVLSVAYDYPNS
jgi:hypothetical protein